jgi:hypothetical protein
VKLFHHVVKDQSVVSLAVVGDQLVGGTTTGGGGGSFPTTTEATLFLWDPAARKKQFETVPVPGAGSITGLTPVPGDRVLGAAGDELFVFDLKSRAVVHRAPLPVSGLVYNAIAPGSHSRLYGLAADGVFSIDPQTYAAKLEAPYKEPLTAGIALDGRSLYAAAGPRVLRCDLGWAPSPDPGKR